MRQVCLAALLLLAGRAAGAQELQLPFSGRWYVAQGGDTINVNAHLAVPAQAFGIDFAKLGGPGDRFVSTPSPQRIDDFFCWSSPVLSPVAGTVIAAANDLPDNPIGTKDAQQPLGNHVVIRASESIYVYVGHLQRGSVLPKTGDTVRPQQPIGKCGNSGNSDFRHVHLHIQDTPTFNVGRGQNPVFGPINVELNGKAFAGVSWPLIRGLFVSNAAQ